MPPVKGLDRISEKWARVSQASQPDYEAGIRNPRTDWAKATAAASENYKMGVQQAINQNRFAKGVEKAGSAKWQENSISKGPARWAEGINLSRNQYEKGFAPYREVIERTTLPPRGPKGDPKNIQRVAVIADALHKKKLSETAGS